MTNASTASQRPIAGPLAGLRVLDLSRLLPGPWASLVLADLGAEVVKVEDPAGGDYLRWMPPLVDGTSALFLALNRGKSSVSLDLKKREDREVFLELCEQADVVVESFRPGVLARLGLSWETLQARNPRLVLCSISGFGQNTTLANRAGHDIGYMALAGVLGLLGSKDGPPAQPNVQVADIAGGSFSALVGLLAALFERESTGRGRWVDVSMTEGAMATLAMTIAPHLHGGGEGPRRGEGTLSGELPCYSIYETQDGRHLAVGALEPKFWSGFCAAIGKPDLESHGLDSGESGRRTREAVAAIIAEKPLAHWAAHFSQHDVCVEPVLMPEELVEHPLHVSRGTFFEGPHGTSQRTPIRFADGESAPAATPAPALGGSAHELLERWRVAPS